MLSWKLALQVRSMEAPTGTCVVSTRLECSSRFLGIRFVIVESASQVSGAEEANKPWLNHVRTR